MQNKYFNGRSLEEVHYHLRTKQTSICKAIRYEDETQDLCAYALDFLYFYTCL